MREFFDGILNMGDETRIDHGRWRNANGQDETALLKYYSGEVALATIPRNRWGRLGLNPEKNEGQVTSSIVDLPRTHFAIVLNADGARGMRVELTDEHSQPISLLSGDHAGRVDNDGGLDVLVKWPAGSVASLGGRKSRLQISLKQDQNSSRLFVVSIRQA